MDEELFLISVSWSSLFVVGGQNLRFPTEKKTGRQALTSFFCPEWDCQICLNYGTLFTGQELKRKSNVPFFIVFIESKKWSFWRRTWKSSLDDFLFILIWLMHFNFHIRVLFKNEIWNDHSLIIVIKLQNEQW